MRQRFDRGCLRLTGIPVRSGVGSGLVGSGLVGSGLAGRLAQRLDIPFALVDSGVTPAGADGAGGLDVPVAIRARDFTSLVDTCLGRGG